MSVGHNRNNVHMKKRTMEKSLFILERVICVIITVTILSALMNKDNRTNGGGGVLYDSKTACSLVTMVHKTKEQRSMNIVDDNL